MRRGETKEFGPLSRSENKQMKTLEEFSISGDGQSKNSTRKGKDIQALATLPHLNKPDVSKPPKVKNHQKPLLTACMGKSHSEDLDPESQPVGYPGPEGLRFDDKGMVLPHCILGSLKDFRCYLEEKQERELVRQIPESQKEPPSEAPGRCYSEAAESGHRDSSGRRNIQSNALEHWHSCMRERKRQQDFLSDLLDRPVENLLMNQANRFREFQEQREFLNQVMPLIHSGYGYRVGSEFWSLPQRYGDEISGITATLTQTEQGRRKPVTHVGQPCSIQQESGVICAETLRSASRTWDQSAYLQHRCQELKEVLRDMDIKKPDIDGLEVIGSGKPLTFVTVCGTPSLERQEKEKEVKEEKKENSDLLSQFDNARSHVPLIPALRFCGHLASWTGNSATHQGEVGISATIFFQAMTGERALSHLELHNEGSTAIFYSWQQLPLLQSFPKLKSQTVDPHFYFNSSSGVILPGDTQQVEFIFKSEKPGIKTERWQLNTHPLLLQGASVQVLLRGVALRQDKTADQRLFIQTKLDKIVMVKLCRSIVDEIVRGIQTPERPSSPPELYITEVQTFENKNPKLQYLHEPVNDMKRLWQEINPGLTWDLSVDTLQQVVLSLPEQDSAQDTSTREKSLAQLSSLLLQLSEPSALEHHHQTAAALGQKLWRKLLDTMADEALRLRNLLGLPERDTWADKLDETLLSDADLADDIKKDEKKEKKGGAVSKEEGGAMSKLKDGNKREPKSPSAEKLVEESKKKGKKREESGKHITEKENQGKESASLTNTQPEPAISQQLPDVELEVMNTYTRLLHQKVYALMEDLVDTLCDLMDEGDE